VKSIELYNYTLTFLSKNNFFLSLRDIHKNLDKINKISLKTTIDYIDFSIQSKIIKRCYKYDIKNKKEITSKAKYYFTDN
jgi:predicted AAA+ superfamily ATPase